MALPPKGGKPEQLKESPAGTDDGLPKTPTRVTRHEERVQHEASTDKAISPTIDRKTSANQKGSLSKTTHSAAQVERSAAEDTDLEESLFHLFDDQEDGKQSPEKVASAAEKAPSSNKKSLSSQRQAPPLSSGPESPSDDNWDLFSDENIEAVQGPYSKPPPREEHTAKPEASAQGQGHDFRGPMPEGETTDNEKTTGSGISDKSGADEAMDPLPSVEDGALETEAPDPERQAPAEGTGAEEGYVLPPQFQQRSGHNTSRGILWGGGILLLLITLIFQYFFYYQRDTLAENTTFRPLVNRLCELAGCRLPPRRDVAGIELADHLMQTHPRYEDSLLITAILVNRAEYSQPFPIVEVVLTDLQQKIIARRHFRPEQYLIGDSPDKEFIPDTEIPLMLEVVDPGENAVGFEFNFY